MDEWHHLYVVYRIDLPAGDSPSELQVTIKEILPSEEDAVREVARLNSLNADKGCKYAFQSAKYYPHGRQP